MNELVTDAVEGGGNLHSLTRQETILAYLARKGHSAISS